MYVHCKVRSTHDIADVGTITTTVAAAATDDLDGHPPAVWP
jgi:flavin reductase (DIM6/NTAB) family NADH-FMN oxidoreductase RutF